MKILITSAITSVFFSIMAILFIPWLFVVSFIFFIVWMCVLWAYEYASNQAKQLNKMYGADFTADDVLYNDNLVHKRAYKMEVNSSTRKETKENPEC